MRTHFANAQLYDGTLSSPIRADLLIEDDRIVQVSSSIRSRADTTLDCTGLAIAPGFIDAHSHNDWFAARAGNSRFFRPFLEQGVTTQVTGNCGFSPFGFEADSPNADLIGSGLFSRGDALGDLSTLEGFVHASQDRLPLNLHPLLGHMSSRISIAGRDSRRFARTS